MHSNASTQMQSSFVFQRQRLEPQTVPDKIVYVDLCYENLANAYVRKSNCSRHFAYNMVITIHMYIHRNNFVNRVLNG